MSVFAKQDGDYHFCKCTRCDHENRVECVNNRCNCCDLEDAFSLVVKAEFG